MRIHHNDELDDAVPWLSALLHGADRDGAARDMVKAFANEVAGLVESLGRLAISSLTDQEPAQLAAVVPARLTQPKYVGTGRGSQGTSSYYQMNFQTAPIRSAACSVVVLAM